MISTVAIAVAFAIQFTAAADGIEPSLLPEFDFGATGGSARVSRNLPSNQPDLMEDASTSEDAQYETIRERYPNRHVKIERQVTTDDKGNYVNHGK